MVTAAARISMCSDYIHDSGEREAVRDFLNTLEREHAWPTRSIIAALRDTWSL